MISRRPIRLTRYDHWKTTEPAEYEPCWCENKRSSHVCTECRPAYEAWLIIGKWIEPEDADT